MKKSNIFVLIAAALVLSACGPNDGASSKDNTMMAKSDTAKTDDAMPKRKAGLWEIKMENSMVRGMGVTTLQCIDEKTDAEMQRSAMKQKDQECTKQTYKRTSTGFEAESVCKSDKMTITSKIVASGDFQSAYKIDMNSRMEPPPHGMPPEMQSTLNVRYLGACTEGMKPGDVKVNGPVMHGNMQHMIKKIPKQ